MTRLFHITNKKADSESGLQNAGHLFLPHMQVQTQIHTGYYFTDYHYFQPLYFRVRFISSNKKFLSFATRLFLPAMPFSCHDILPQFIAYLITSLPPPDSKCSVLGTLSVLFLVIRQGSLHSLRSYGICSNKYLMNE